MIALIAYIIFLAVELVVAITLCAFTASLLWSSFWGSPYVPTKKKELLDFLKEAKMKKGQVFLELGSGDGRVARIAAQEYGVKAIGIDINPLLIWWSRFWNVITGVKNVEFKVQNLFKTDISKADFVYLFLMPELLEKLKGKLKKEGKKNAIFISHGFKIHGWDKYLKKKIDHKPFPTYYYVIR